MSTAGVPVLSQKCCAVRAEKSAPRPLSARTAKKVAVRVRSGSGSGSAVCSPPGRKKPGRRGKPGAPHPPTAAQGGLAGRGRPATWGWLFSRSRASVHGGGAGLRRASRRAVGAAEHTPKASGVERERERLREWENWVQKKNWIAPEFSVAEEIERAGVE